MVQAIPVSDLTLRQVKQQFGLVQVDDPTVAAWQTPTNGRECLLIYVPADDRGDRGEAVRSTDCLSPIFSMTTVHHDLGIVLNVLKRIGAELLP